MIKILHVITDLNTGGAEKLLVDLLPRIQAEDQKAELCVFNSTDTPLLRHVRDTGIKIHSFGKKPDYYNPRHIIQLIKLSKGFDIVHTHNTAPQLFGAIASLFSKCKWIITEHTTTSHHRVWWYRPIERWMYRRYNNVICISEGVRESMMAIAGKKYARSEVIPNGIDLDKFKSAQEADKFAIGSSNPNKKILLMVGRYSYQKDQATIIRSLTLLPQEVELWLAGYGETEELLKNLVDELKLKDRVHLLGMRNDVPNIMAVADIIIQSSHIEGFGLAAVEAMASGKPVIASDIPGLHDVVDGAGLFFEHANHKQLADIISQLLGNPTLYEKFVDEGRKRAEIFSIDTMAKKYIESYKKCL